MILGNAKPFFGDKRENEVGYKEGTILDPLAPLASISLSKY